MVAALVVLGRLACVERERGRSRCWPACCITSARSTFWRAPIGTTVCFKDPAALPQVMRDWHANVGKAIVENWGFPEHISEAVGEHENIDRTVGHPDVTDILTRRGDDGRLHGPRNRSRTQHAGREGVLAPRPRQRQMRRRSCATALRRSARCARRSATEEAMQRLAVRGWRQAVASRRLRLHRASLSRESQPFHQPAQPLTANRDPLAGTSYTSCRILGRNRSGSRCILIASAGRFGERQAALTHRRIPNDR